MKKGRYRRCVLWRLLFFGLPVMVSWFMLKEVSSWDEPRAGPKAVDEKELSPHYWTVTIILAAVAAIPYLGLLLRFWERYQVSEESIRRKGLLRNRTLPWKEIIEYRDFLSYIHLLPIRERSELYIDYYLTFKRHKELTRTIGRKCREVEANVMVRRRHGRLVLCDFGAVANGGAAVAAALLFVVLRQRIVFLGIVSGMVLALVSAWVWVVSRRHPERWKSGGYMYASLFVVFLMLPPAYFAQAIRVRGLVALGTFGVLYAVGMVAGSGVISSLLPSRKRRKR